MRALKCKGFTDSHNSVVCMCVYIFIFWDQHAKQQTKLSWEGIVDLPKKCYTTAMTQFSLHSFHLFNVSKSEKTTLHGVYTSQIYTKLSSKLHIHTQSIIFDTLKFWKYRAFYSCACKNTYGSATPGISFPQGQKWLLGTEWKQGRSIVFV